ncbi:MAG: L-seryl-tRNA(Sec) selenium transferase, partial [Chloroflexota bacterium]|nr:L-seryl-tRNA(Sec) selenium transferase [Chloroflexota bacterium]
MTTDARPRPPSVNRLLSILAAADVEVSEPAALATLVREVIDEERQRLAAGAPQSTEADLADAVLDRLEQLGDPGLTVPPHVINATGVILHTNLGRAPWPRAARLAATQAARSYGYLELDEASGRRGPRYRQAEDHLVALTGADDAMVVTNNAAALALVVGLAGRRGAVVVSRGELVEIGGGVRIPDVIARAGVRLIEIGTTNRTRAADFAAPLADGSARVVLRVHPSNFAISGFTESPDPAEVAAVAHRHGAIVIDDLGSGALLDTETFGLDGEPTPRERLGQGADLVLFSGDKLVGGPQAGLIVGRADLVARLRRDPLARAVRPDKAILAGVAATLAIYRAGRATRDIPVWQMIALDPEGLRARAAWIVERVAAEAGRSDLDVVAVESAVGGGSLPGQT